jgi:hypothetical protein
MRSLEKKKAPFLLGHTLLSFKNRGFNLKTTKNWIKQ